MDPLKEEQVDDVCHVQKRKAYAETKLHVKHLKTSESIRICTLQSNGSLCLPVFSEPHHSG